MRHIRLIGEMNMKNILIVLLTVIASVSFAQTSPAAKKSEKSMLRNYGIAGCGLGSVVMGKRGGQVSAATTNNTSFNQMIGITAGTLNCIDSASSRVANRMDHFILVNRTQVQGDIARGNGETILALSSYMGCESASNEIASQLKNNYSTIFTSEAAANEITDSIITVVLATPALAQQCNSLASL